MAREFAKRFYKSNAWEQARAEYYKHADGLCESCLARGVYTPGEIVHHIKPLTPGNINDPTVALSFSNLRLVCRQCHADEHRKPLEEKRENAADYLRYIVDKYGNIHPKEEGKANDSKRN